MGTVRRLYCWLFAFSSAASLQIAIWGELRTPYEGNASPPVRSLFLAVAFVCLAAVFGTAWWTVFKSRPSGRAWGIAASAVYAGLPVCLHAASSQPLGANSFVVFGLGIVGLATFFPTREQATSGFGAGARARTPGDWTGDLSEGLAGFLIFVAIAGIFVWWNSQVGARAAPGAGGIWHRLGFAILVGLTVSAVHEIGHALTGILLGMKLRGVELGPFQWQIREGSWRFQFKPEGFVLTGGATTVVPTVRDFPRRRFVSMVAAGPMANLVTGAVAMWIVLDAKDGWTVSGGALALFAIWSLVLCMANLIPFRAGANYSDGATILQSLSSGPWADFQCVLAAAGSCLATPLRPMDFDIQRIERAGRAITGGLEGLLLRLYAYTYYLDREELCAAERTLGEAEAICRQLASGAPHELLSALVFGAGYVRRDPVAAREWWNRIDADSRARPDTSYWIARSALLWVEGDPRSARAAWQRANVLAEKLPRAGAYEFERHCCSMLLCALDEPGGPLDGERGARTKVPNDANDSS